MVSTVFEDNEISVHFALATGEAVQRKVAVLSYCPMNHGFVAKGIPAQAALNAMKVDVFGIIAKSNNWYPRESMLAAAKILRPLLQPYTERLAYGSSMWGHGAIKYSALMGCDHVLALAPQ